VTKNDTLSNGAAKAIALLTLLAVAAVVGAGCLWLVLYILTHLPTR
jgi:hypothetical protein